ncbi:MAG TPA: hypothetical protein VM243_15580 [Phycisphaerae bacterium]|nr:hypothetical protein [Phycisphaerae bacterium]
MSREYLASRAKFQCFFVAVACLMVSASGPAVYAADRMMLGEYFTATW